jgi:hypothetical protein
MDAEIAAVNIVSALARADTSKCGEPHLVCRTFRSSYPCMSQFGKVQFLVVIGKGCRSHIRSPYSAFD